MSAPPIETMDSLRKIAIEVQRKPKPVPIEEKKIVDPAMEHFERNRSLILEDLQGQIYRECKLAARSGCFETRFRPESEYMGIHRLSIIKKIERDNLLHPPQGSLLWYYE